MLLAGSKLHSQSVTSNNLAYFMTTPIKQEKAQICPPCDITEYEWKTLDWIDLNIPSYELRISTTLNTGQCFNWKRLYSATTEESWLGMLENNAFILRQTAHSIHCARLSSPTTSDIKEEFKGENSIDQTTFMREYFGRYFQTDDSSMRELYSHWSGRCPRMKIVCEHVPGLRVVRQDPFECLISFICSSNNNISRIILMLDRLRFHYGQYRMTVRLRYQNGHYQSDSPPESISVCYDPFSVITGGGGKTSSSSSTSSPISTPIVNGRPLQPHLASPSPKKQNKKSSTSTTIDQPNFQSTMSDTLQSDGIDRNHSNDETMAFHLFQFPTAEALSLATESDLRSLGMGYRAKFLVESSKIAAGKPDGAAAWFAYLRSLSKAEVVQSAVPTDNIKKEQEVEEASPKRRRKKPVATKDVEDVNSSGPPSLLPSRLFVQQELLQFPGVGRKVADCVALFSLDQRASIPVDTHVWDIATRDYAPSLLKSKSLTPTIYEAVGDVFRSIFGDKAGWAHSVLFAAELSEFRKALPTDMQAEMKQFTEANKKLKKEKKEEKESCSTIATTTTSVEKTTDAKKRKNKEKGSRGQLTDLSYRNSF